MSKAEIQSWISTSERVEEDEEAATSFQWGDFYEETNWPVFLEYAKGQLLTSSTKTRTEFLTTRLSPLVSKGGMYESFHVGYVFKIMFRYPYRTENSSSC